MSGLAIGLLGIAALLVLLALRTPIGVAMLAVGAGGYTAMNGWTALLNVVKTEPYYTFSTYSLTVVPLFLLMGQFAGKAGLSQALFRAARAWVGHWPGGLAMAAIGGCAGFGAICGSSLATAAAMGQAALPELRRAGYSGPLATGTLAAGGTLGILIPPSVVLVIYALLTEQNIARLFVAAVVPGLLATAGYMIAIALVVRRHPEAGPAAPRADAAEKLASLRGTWPVALIFGVVVGGIYVGWFTPTEGAAVGAMATGLLAVGHGGMRLSGLMECLTATAESTAMIFLILLGADLFNAFLALTRMPAELAQLIAGAGMPPLLVLVAILAIYLVMGCIMDSLSMILLTMPIFFPVIMGLDFGLTPEATAIWFGVLALMVVEIGLITPPVGMNVFIINAMARDVPLIDSFRGVVPFLMSDLVRVAVLVAFPQISLLPVAWLS